MYVVDIILGARDEAKMTCVKGRVEPILQNKSSARTSTPLFGSENSTNQPSGEIWIGQTSYTEMLLEKFGLKECKPVSTPVNPWPDETQDSECNQKIYQGAVGSLINVPVHKAYAVSRRVE